MEALSRLETRIAEVHQTRVPHLPVAGQVWLSRNTWWLVLIGVVLGAVGLLIALIGLLTLSGVLTLAGLVGAAVAAAFIGVLLHIVALGLMVVIPAIAVRPLRSGLKRGWDLLFLAVVLNFIIAAISSIVSVTIIGLLYAALWAVVETYFLFEVRAYFMGPEIIEIKPDKKSSSPSSNTKVGR